MSKIIKYLVISLSVFLIVSALISAQTRSGTLKVIVIDDEGNVIPGVALTLSSPVMMGEKSLVTNVVGEALFVNLTPGQ